MFVWAEYYSVVFLCMCVWFIFVFSSFIRFRTFLSYFCWSWHQKGHIILVLYLLQRVKGGGIIMYASGLLTAACVYTSVFLLTSLSVSFCGCSQPVSLQCTLSTLQDRSSETLMLIDPSEEVWTQVCCRRPWLWHGCQGILGNQRAYRSTTESVTSQSTSDPVLF